MGPRRAFRAEVDGKGRGNKAGSPAWLIVAAAVLLGAWTCVFPFPAFAQSAPFAGMAGRWTGTGTVTLDDGSTERIRCRATYSVAGHDMGLTLTCASEAYKFDLEARVVADGTGAITGTWSESSRNVSGNLRGHGANGNFQVTASGPSFNANISLVTHGNHQSIVMRPDSQFRAASIALSR
jgi:hypothetical protein